MRRLLLLLVLVLLASCIAYPLFPSHHLLRNDQLFYSHRPPHKYNGSFTFCESLGGQLASNFTKEDRQFLQSFGTELGLRNWLDAERTTGGYRWRLSGQLIEPEMWYPGYPKCGGGCAVISTPDGYLVDIDTRAAINPLCVFNMSNEASITKLLSKLSLVDALHRADLHLIITNYTQEKRILQENALFQKLSSDLQELESSLSQESNILSNDLLKHELALSQKSDFNLVVIIFVIIIDDRFRVLHDASIVFANI